MLTSQVLKNRWQFFCPSLECPTMLNGGKNPSFFLCSRVYEIVEAEDVFEFVFCFIYHLSQLPWKLKTSLNKLQSLSLWQIPGEVEKVWYFCKCTLPKSILFTETWYASEDKNSKDRFNEVNSTSYVATLFTHVLQHRLNSVIKCTKQSAPMYYNDGHIRHT